MKVYASPVNYVVDYKNYDFDKERKKEQKHRIATKKWLLKNGYTGKLTGEIITFPVADGHAEYMLADGRKSFLVHLPYGDAYQYRDVQFIPKAEIVRRLKLEKQFNEKWSKQKG